MIEAKRKTSRSSAYLRCAALLLVLAVQSAAYAQPMPWQRTETREACSDTNVLREPYFGDTHVHTQYSIDAVLFNTLNTPRDAYRFATGQAIDLPPYDAQNNGAHTIQLDRPMDFAAVTDHAEGFGAQSVCFLPGFAGYDSSECEQLRLASVSADPVLVQGLFAAFLLPVVISETPGLPTSVCGPAPESADCAARQSLFWQDIQAAAEEFYDRSSACTFTPFVGYEWTGTPNNANLHRNVLFRNDVAPALPVSYIEEQKPQGLWAALRSQCQDTLPGCDWLAIPHNSNLSGAGLMFVPENADGSALTAGDAIERASMEPLVEIYQHKGSSECRPGVDTTDEQCGFELVDRTVLIGPSDPEQTFEPLLYVRNALKEGLLEEERIGVNPLRMGIIASTDTHNAAPGYTSEDTYVGHVGVNDDTPARGQLTLGAPTALGEHSPGGLAVVWSEENSRDALFAAMRRRETYGTSGPRHVVRFFAGAYPSAWCDDPDRVATGYSNGVPMGSELGEVRYGGASPVFAVSAMRDPGAAGQVGTPLERIQIVKGWIDASGEAREKVFDVAGTATVGTGVDVATCTPTAAGASDLCATWEDPDFDADERAFYYARVLETPTCRWSTEVCNDNAIDCSDPAAVPAEFELCCEPRIPKIVQERAWTSPIWYRPEAIGRMRGAVVYGEPGADRDRLKLTALVGAGLSHDPDAEDLRVIVRDDDVILDVTIPAGTLRNGKVRDFASLDVLKFRTRRHRPAKLALRTARGDLATADRVDHMVTVEVRIGASFATEQSRLWLASRRKLSVR